MSDYNRAARAYWSAMVLAGPLTGAWGVYHSLFFTPTEWAQFLALLSLVVVTASQPIRIPNTNASVTAGDTFTFLSVLLLGVPAAVLLGMVDSFVSSHRTTRRATSWLAAPAMMALTVLVAGHAFYLTLAATARITAVPVGTVRVNLDLLLVPLALMTFLQYFLNGITVATLCALKGRRS